MSEKYCKACDQTKDETEFYIVNKKRAARRAICKRCDVKKRTEKEPPYYPKPMIPFTPQQAKVLRAG